jgi:tetratricopeptide (TPR) repeat protein
MKHILLLVSFLSAALFSPAIAQEMHPHRHERPEKLGTVNFSTSCSPKAQKQFNHAVAWLHSFEYEEAEKAFTEVAATDPQCGMAYWGIAMSNYHPLWVPPTPAELKKGWNAVEKAKAAGQKTQREQDYIAAIELFYKDHDKLDHRARAFAYSDAMKQLHTRNPTDREAGVFYALTLIATGMMSPGKTYEREKQAAQILNDVLAREPQHPGVSHYLIHSYDYPALAQLALPAARSYAKIAPASAHAQHMPSHIFTRLGLWPEAIRSNLDAHAAGVLDELRNIQKVEPQTFKVAYAYTAIPARYVLERRQWSEAAKLTLPEEEWKDFPWQRFPWATAHIHFARAIGAARSGDIATARTAVDKLEAIRQALSEVKGEYDWAKQVDIQRMIALAWLQHAEGKDEEALRQLRAAADLDDATDKHPVTPGSIFPAREQLGGLLLELKQPAEALKEFEASFRNTPERFNGLYGAARAAKMAGDQKAAKAYYTKLLALAREADTTRSEIEEARAFAGNGKPATR